MNRERIEARRHGVKIDVHSSEWCYNGQILTYYNLEFTGKTSYRLLNHNSEKIQYFLTTIMQPITVADARNQKCANRFHSKTFSSLYNGFNNMLMDIETLFYTYSIIASFSRKYQFSAISITALSYQMINIIVAKRII